MWRESEKVDPGRAIHIREGDLTSLGNNPASMINTEIQRIIIHVDMDSFYASAEVRKNPSLKGRPVVVGADPRGGRGRGVVSTCSYEARSYGIHSAMPISEAYNRCPHAVFLLPDYPLYTTVSSQVMAVLHTHSQRVEQVSIDEAYLDMSHLSGFPKALEKARQIKSEVLAETGLTCSIGVAPSKVVAKIASDYKKPDGLTIILPGEEEVFLSRLPVSRVPGIGRKTSEELSRHGIQTIGDLASVDVQVLIGWFGRGAVTLHHLARGIDGREVEGSDISKSISREVTFDEDTDDREGIKVVIDRMAEDLDRALAAEGCSYRTLTVKVRFEGFQTRTKAVTMPRPSWNTREAAVLARRFIGQMLDGRRVRLVGIRLSGLARQDKYQTALFDFTS